MLTDQTKNKIVDYLVNEGNRFVDDNVRSVERAEQMKPFHARLIPSAFAGWGRLSERSFSTRSGGWFQEIAKIVASQFHPVVEKNYRFSGRIRPAAEAHITAIIEDMERSNPRRIPNRLTDLTEVVGVQGPGGSVRQTISDLFVESRDGGEMYFEIKTPQPNKDTSKAMKYQILLISALRKENNASSFAAMAYNPYGMDKPYNWNYALQFLELDTDLLVGQRFWAKIGESSTFDELLDLAEIAGRKIDAHVSAVMD